MEKADKTNINPNLYKANTNEKSQREIDTEAVIAFLTELILQQRECQRNRRKE